MSTTRELNETLAYLREKRAQVERGEITRADLDFIERLAQEHPVDPVAHPSHYTSGSVECIDAIRAALTPEEFRGFCKGNMIKYVWRERLKGGAQDIEKAVAYAGFLNKGDK